MFRVGQRVVCIAHPRFRVHDMGLPGFEKGKIYTISGFYEEPTYGLMIKVEELDQRVGGHHKGFRPIVERKTDISLFEEILRRESIPDECIPAEYGVDWGASA